MRAPLLVLTVWSTAAAAEVPDVVSFVAIARDEAVRLRWTNPADHSGVLILRAAEAIDAAPADGVTYSVGQSLGNAVVVYADADSVVATFDDAALVNGTRYRYRIYNLDALTRYSSGNVPTSSGVDATPSSGTGTTSKWCYAVGAAAVMQPVADLGAGVFFAGNAGTVNASNTAAGSAADGDERWRPLRLPGSVQARFPVVTLYQEAQKTILTGDSSGHAYAVNAATGALRWTALAGASLGDAIVAQPVVQLRAYADAAFAAANPNRDLIFFATRNASAVSNTVYALDAPSGVEVWRYAPGDLDVVNGGMLVDYEGNRLFVASRSNAGTQQSLRVLDSLTGAYLTGFSLGDIDTGVVLNTSLNQALVATTSGAVWGIALGDLSVAFQVAVGPPASWPFPAGNGFIVSLTSGAVQRWSVSGASTELMWTAAVADPSGVNLDYVAQVAYVGSSDGKVHQLSLATGADQLQLDLADGTTGTPSIDTVSRRMHVGTLGGHVCALALP